MFVNNVALQDTLRLIAACASMVVVAATPYVLMTMPEMRWPQRLRITGAALVAVAIVGAYLQTLGTPGSLWRLIVIDLGAIAQAAGMVVFATRERITSTTTAQPKMIDRLATVPAALVVADGQSRILTVAGRPGDVLGWTANDLKGRPLATIIPSRFVAKHLKAFDRLGQTGEVDIAAQPLPTFALNHEGHERPVTLFIMPLTGRGDPNSTPRFLGVVQTRDLTQPTPPDPT